LSISRSMTESKTVLNCTMAKFYYGNLNPINYEVDKRPLVFPFLVNLLNTLTGVRYQNGFILNFIIMFLFLAGVFIVTRKLLDGWSAAAAMLLIVAYPVFTIYGTSAGFDLLNAVFFIMVISITFRFIKSPSSSAFALLFSSLLVLANIRYESVVFLPLVVLLVLPNMKWQYLRDSSFLFFTAPLVNLPYLWNRLLKPGAYYESVKEITLFSFGAVEKNAALFFRNLIDLQYNLPYAGVISVISILIFVYLVVQTCRRRIFVEKHNRCFIVVLLVTVGLSTLMYFAHFMGQCTHPSTARFFIILSICFALGPVALRAAKPQLFSGRVLLLFAAVCFIYYHPIAVKGRFVNTLTLNRLTQQCIDFLEKSDNENALVVSSRPGQYVALGFGAVDFNYANNNKAALLNETRRHLYSRLIVFQEIMYETGKPSADSALDADYILKPLYEIQTTADAYLRISQVVISDGQD
ncbi:MAG: glycosyltransferase family 39 protein, partial [Sedimentisphaerales bacterium]